MPAERVKGSDLKLGDIVQEGEDGTYNQATVCAIGEEMIYFFRPYTQTADFAYAGAKGPTVICYVGISQYEVDKDRWFIRVGSAPNLRQL